MRKYFIGWIITLLAIVVGIPGSSAQTGFQIVVVNEFLNVRFTPAIGAEVIGTVDAGYVFDTVTARSGDNQWVRVEFQCQEGWINLAPVVVLSGDINTLPTADPRSIPFGGFESPRAGFTSQAGSITGAATAGVRIRSGPSTGYPTIGNILFNQRFTITGRNSCASWLQVSFDGVLGWVSASYVQPIGEGSNVLDLPVGGIVAETLIPQIDGDQEYFATLRLMLERLNLAQTSLDTIRASWTDAALQGRAICQDYPASPSDFVIASPLLAANYGTLFPLVSDFDAAMADVRAAIDLFIQVCNQPGTGNPVGQATVQGALNTINEADQLFASLRQRLNDLIPELSANADECLLIYNRSAEVLPQVQYGTIYGDAITRRTYARGYCFSGIQGQIINLQVVGIPPAEFEIFAAISSLANPTDFLSVIEGSTGAKINVGPIELPVTGQYLLILADLQEDSDTRTSFGEYAFYLSDLSLTDTFTSLDFDTETQSLTLTERQSTRSVDFNVDTSVQANCPSLSFTCAQLFSCDQATACLNQGNFGLDTDADGIACNEPGNLLLDTTACNVGGNTTSNNLTCAAFSTCAEAQASYNAGNTSLDGDNDGIPCETLCLP